MKRLNWQVMLGISLVVLSIVFYLIHFAIFRDAHHIFIYMIGDIAFIPIEVLLVTLVIHRVLAMREKQAIREKLNMVIGAFFSEVGTRLLTYFSDLDPKIEEIRYHLLVTGEWSEAEFIDVSSRLRRYDYSVEIKKVDLRGLRAFLMAKRDFLLRLLENPNLLEHESFSNLLWSVFHLTEELAHRDDVSQLTDIDCDHVAGDIKRAYVSLVHEWLSYMKHLKANYPYLFSMAMRINPFDQFASPFVQ